MPFSPVVTSSQLITADASRLPDYLLMNRNSKSTSIPHEEVLEDLLSEPTPEVVETLSRLSGDILILGVAGKMGPSLARMARRAFDVAGVGRRVIGAARFS